MVQSICLMQLCRIFDCQATFFGHLHHSFDIFEQHFENGVGERFAGYMTR